MKLIAGDLGSDASVMLACGWPLDLTLFSADAKFPLITSSMSPAEILRQIIDYYTRQVVPPGYRILCGFEVVHATTDVAVARQCADYAGVLYGSDEDALTIAQRVVDEAPND